MNSKPPTDPPPKHPPRTDPPKDNRPPTKPPKKAVALADALIFAEAERIRADLQTPARRSPMEARSATASVRPEESGGPAQATRGQSGECLQPGYDVACGSAASGSDESPRLGAGDNVPREVAGARKGRADGAVGAATFTLPPIPTVPSFDNGPWPYRGQRERRRLNP